MNKNHPTDLRLSQGLQSNVLQLEAKDGSVLRRFKMLAYTGASLESYGSAFVLDIAGMDIENKIMPIFLGHDFGQIAGQSDNVLSTGQFINIEGDLSRVTEASKKVTELSDEGFKWQASIGVDRMRNFEEVEPGAVVTVNEREFPGPITVVRNSRLIESSFVPLGRDSNTRSVVLSHGAFSGLPVIAKWTSESGRQKAHLAVAAIHRERFKCSHMEALSATSEEFKRLPNIHMMQEEARQKRHILAAKAHVSANGGTIPEALSLLQSLFPRP